MTLTSSELREIIADAATLSERLSDQFAPMDAPDGDTLAQTRLTRWCQAAAQGDWTRFRARLAAEGLDEKQVRRRLGPGRLQDDAPLPQWAHMLEHILQVMPKHADLLAPFVEVGWQNLADRVGTLVELLTESAQADLENHLRQRLSEIAFPALSAQSDLRVFSQRPAEVWLTIFRQYPVLARLLAVSTDFWVTANARLIERIHADQDAIRTMFCPSQELGGIAAIVAGLSDPHQQGQSVLRVTFANGVRLFYKPRSLDPETAWFRLLDALNHAGIDLPFICLQILAREGYGWMEAVASQVCADWEQARRCYRRAGMTLCLLYLFGGSDFQQDNVIVCADQPVLIDLETLLTPAVRGQDARMRPQRIGETVLRTHFLPDWERGTDGRFQAAGGMEAIRLAPDIAPGWNQRADAVSSGFQGMAAWLTTHQEFVLTALAQFSRVRVRVIFHDTPVYQRLLQHSLQPEMLKNGLDRSIALERLARLDCPPAEYARHLPRIGQEIEMLARLDIPYFETRADTADFALACGEILPAYFTEPCFQAVTRNFHHFAEADSACQIRLIRTVYDFKAAVERPFQENLQGLNLSGSWDGAETPFWDGQGVGCRRWQHRHVKTPPLPLPEEDFGSLVRLFEDTAAELAERLKLTAIRTVAGATVWMIPEERVAADQCVYRFRQSDWFMYQGVTGIALFLAAMHTLRPQAGYDELARAALQPLTNWLKQPWIPGNTGIGGASGMGSLVYAFATIGQFLGEPLFIEHAGQIGALITRARLAADDRLDVFDGAAGAILGLLALYAATSANAVLEQAARAGEHLLACRTETLPRAWRTIRPAPVSGLSHGMAGIVYALLRLFAATGREVFRQAAVEGLACERALFSAADHNWCAFDSSAEQPEFWTTYCHGAPGIGLARLGGLDALDTPEIRADIAAALHTTANVPRDGVDFVCCGNFGRIETLLTASRRLSQPELLERARRQAAELITRSTKSEGFRVFENLPPRVVNPGFFRGMAGIGYELLRLAWPERFPSVVLWE